MRFIEFNNRILDFSRYRDEVLTLRRIFLIDLKQYFRSFGFELKRKKLSSYAGAELLLYNKNTDIEVRITIKKKLREKFS